MKSNTKKRRQGFTLLEIMLVIAIIGIMSVIAIKGLNIRITTDEAKRTTTTVLIGDLSGAVNRYYLNVGKYPSSLDALVSDPGAKGWAGPYLKKIKKDAWGDDFTYSVSGGDFEIRSNAGGSEGGPISSNDL